MGRGRAKAKQTKVARELKYHVANTDFTALQRELTDGEKAAAAVQQLERDTSHAAAIEDEDPYADVYASDDDD